MKLLFEDYPCSDPKVAKLRDQLVFLYRKLNVIIDKARPFEGFIDVGELPEKFFMSVHTYLPLQMSFSREELTQLAGYSGMNSAALVAQASTPLERLLVATIWKNGDIQKVSHVVDGLGNGSGTTIILDKTSKCPVFKQFGRHLAAPDQHSIADQHTLRAYRMLTENDPSDEAHLKDTSTGDEVQRYVD